MKKSILFVLIGLFFAINVKAQEEVSKVLSYVQYQDTLFIAKEVTITNTGIEGINDTIVRYLPPALDSAGLLKLYTTTYINTANELSAKLRNARKYRKFNSINNEFETLISGLNGQLDSILVEEYEERLKGRWKYIDSAGNERLFDLVDHPNRSDVLRLNEDGGANENINFTPSGRWRFTARINSQNIVFIWNGEDRNKPVFQLEKWFLPGTAVGGFDNTRFIKIR